MNKHTSFWKDFPNSFLQPITKSKKKQVWFCYERIYVLHGTYSTVQYGPSFLTTDFIELGTPVSKRYRDNICYLTVNSEFLYEERMCIFNIVLEDICMLITQSFLNTF